jgi:hypothetical protein
MNMPLDKTHQTIRDAVRLVVLHPTLLSLKLRASQKLVPPMPLKSLKACAATDQDINGLEILAQIVELASDAGLDLPASWSFLLGNPQEVSTSQAAIVTWSMLPESL